MAEAQADAYRYFDLHVRALPKDPGGVILDQGAGFSDNDVDAFRHAYVSGVFTQEYSEMAADLLGRLNELNPADLYSNARDPRSRNMDLWNNAVGRKYGAKCRTRDELWATLHAALRSGELITSLHDSRRYVGTTNDPKNEAKPVIVLREASGGRNELFFDMVELVMFTREEFIAAIKAGRYPGYTIKILAGVPTPVSKPDKRRTNNLA
jgi:hypothetical protein